MMLRNYYNENDPYPAQWLRNLIAAGHLPAGDVDERSITEVQASDLEGYDQCHFFAGIGGWPLALALAGWDGPAWTGSCPCQPLSSAGQRKGHADERHLWPAFHALIAQCKPATVFGEQVASKDGREWLAGVRVDLEHLGYAVGAADLPAAGVGAPHLRQRLYWCSDSHGNEHFGKGKPTRSVTSNGKQSLEKGFKIEHRRFAELVAMDVAQRHSGYTEARRLVDGISCRMGGVAAYGNAIVPQAGAEFVRAFMEC